MAALELGICTAAQHRHGRQQLLWACMTQLNNMERNGQVHTAGAARYCHDHRAGACCQLLVAGVFAGCRPLLLEELRTSIANSAEELATSGDRQFNCCPVEIQSIQRVDAMQVSSAWD